MNINVGCCSSTLKSHLTQRLFQKNLFTIIIVIYFIWLLFDFYWVSNHNILTKYPDIWHIFRCEACLWRGSVPEARIWFCGMLAIFFFFILMENNKLYVVSRLTISWRCCYSETDHPTWCWKCWRKWLPWDEIMGWWRKVILINYSFE